MRTLPHRPLEPDREDGARGIMRLSWSSGCRKSIHTPPCQKGRFFMGVGEGALERVEQAGHGGFEGTEEFRSGGSGAEVEPWEQTGGGEGFAVGGEAVAEFGGNHSGVFFL